MQIPYASLVSYCEEIFISAIYNFYPGIVAICVCILLISLHSIKHSTFFRSCQPSWRNWEYIHSLMFDLLKLHWIHLFENTVWCLYASILCWCFLTHHCLISHFICTCQLPRGNVSCLKLSRVISAYLYPSSSLNWWIFIVWYCFMLYLFFILGQKGIGFKSVFRVTDRPEIHSNGYHIGFDTNSKPLGYILPHWLNKDQRLVDLPEKYELFSL